MDITTDATLLLDSSANLTFAMNVTGATAKKTSVIIVVTENGAPRANAKTATISSRPNVLWNEDSFQNLPPYVICATGNYLVTNVSTTIGNVGAFASNPFAIHTKSAPTAVTPTNQTQGCAAVEIASQSTDAVECRICEQKVHLATHKWYIPRLKRDVDDPKRKRVPRDEVGTRPFEEPEPDDPDTRIYVEREPPLQVYADYEAITDAEGNQTPILLCAETDEDDDTVSFYGPDYTSDFFDWLEQLAVDQDGDDRNMIVFFHNLKGFDGMFILQHCYSRSPWVPRFCP